MNHIFSIVAVSLLVCGCSVQPASDTTTSRPRDHWQQLEDQLAHKQSQRQDLRGILTSSPESSEAGELSARIMQLNQQIRQLEKSLEYAPTPFVSAEPIQPIAGLMPAQREAFAAADHSAFVVRAKQNIAFNMKDPSSVQFRGLQLGHEGIKPILCGEINSKNSYGGYVGFRPFYATQQVSDQAVDSEDSRFAKIISRKCADLVKTIE